MRLIKRDGEGAVVRVTDDELVWIANAINEALNGIDDPELQTRTAARRSEMEGLARDLRAMLSR